MVADSSAQTLAPAADPRKPPTRAYLIFAVGILAISFNGIFVTLANTNGDVAGFYRLGIATLVLTVPVLIGWNRNRNRPTGKDMLIGVPAGLFSAADLGMWNTAVLIIGPGIATLLGNTAPLWVALGAWLIFREKLRPMYWAGLGVALTGVALIVGLDAIAGLGRNVGNLLGLGTGIAYAGFQLTTHKARTRLDTLTYMWLYSGVGALALLVISLTLHHPLLHLPVNTYLALLAMALISHMGGWSLVSYAFGHLPVSLVTVTLLTQPVITTVLAAVLFQDYPNASQIGGGVVALLGILLVHLSINRAQSAPVIHETSVEV